MITFYCKASFGHLPIVLGSSHSVRVTSSCQSCLVPPHSQRLIFSQIWKVKKIIILPDNFRHANWGYIKVLNACCVLFWPSIEAPQTRWKTFINGILTWWDLMRDPGVRGSVLRVHCPGITAEHVVWDSPWQSDDHVASLIHKCGNVSDREQYLRP